MNKFIKKSLMILIALQISSAMTASSFGKAPTSRERSLAPAPFNRTATATAARAGSPAKSINTSRGQLLPKASAAEDCLAEYVTRSTTEFAFTRAAAAQEEKNAANKATEETKAKLARVNAKKVSTESLLREYGINNKRLQQQLAELENRLIIAEETTSARNRHLQLQLTALEEALITAKNAKDAISLENKNLQQQKSELEATLSTANVTQTERDNALNQNRYLKQTIGVTAAVTAALGALTHHPAVQNPIRDILAAAFRKVGNFFNPKQS